MKNKLKSYYGIFTFKCDRDKSIVLNGDEEYRILYQLVSSSSNENWMCVVRFFGRQEVKYGEVCLAEVTPVTQKTLDMVNSPENFIMKFGSTILGNFKCLYTGFKIVEDSF